MGRYLYRNVSLLGVYVSLYTLYSSPVILSRLRDDLLFGEEDSDSGVCSSMLESESFIKKL